MKIINGTNENKNQALVTVSVLTLTLPLPPPLGLGPPGAARSLGSVALRKAENMEGGLHLNVFTVDFNEELVALYGGSLRRQTLFLHECIKAVLRLYKVGLTTLLENQQQNATDRLDQFHCLMLGLTRSI